MSDNFVLDCKHGMFFKDRAERDTALVEGIVEEEDGLASEAASSLCSGCCSMELSGRRTV
eukprot:3324155-Ditylum_brightwellii.AAC.1